MKASKRDEVRRALENIEDTLERQFASGRIWYESDLHQVILSYLHRELVDKDERWVVGSKHEFDRHWPDVVCYYRFEDRYADFHRDYPKRDEAIVAFIEVKFASGLKHDLEKLAALERDWDALTWMIYGDHFCRDIHSTWFGKQQERAEQIKEWVEGNRSLRGRTILRCGEIPSEKSACGDALSALNSRNAGFWAFQKPRR